MHAEAEEWVRRWTTGRWRQVVEFGSRDVNGSARYFVNAARYHGIDVVDGPGVDEVADARTWRPDRAYDLAICTEVLEHTPEWWDVLATMRDALCPGGLAVITTACEPRPAHSAVDGGPLREGEYYANVPPMLLSYVLSAMFVEVQTDMVNADVRAVAWR